MPTTFFSSSAVTSGPAFCPHCGTILDHPDTNNIVCSACEHRCRYEDFPSLTFITYSEDRPKPKWLDAEVGMSEVTGPARATVEETCPKCGNREMEFYTLQLRSADEGQTVFYECKKCGHKSSVNN
ncbi:hypothetical protein CCR75_000576 [Bremia lactucae]|uniref:DNA-directed RNA polymerase subunit n=1 Tax=Bremia lactucae TaxID=4779 RepID=A0A976NYQ4_BRELC|nr:hypothetical protein CCR75_000576 [Bremia lactucae]